MPTQTLIRWLLNEGRKAHSVPELLAAFGPEVAKVSPLERIWAGTKVLHPQAAAYLWVWREGQPVIERSLGYDVIDAPKLADSPILRLRQGTPEVHFKAPDSDGMADLQSVWDAGYTELYGDSIYFRDRWMGGVTWSTSAAFSSANIQMFRDLNPALSAVIEPLAADLVTSTLLRTYLGADAGNRVFHGQINRGDGSSLRAVVWVSDVRDFTRLSEKLTRDELLGLLNDGFELVVNTVEEHGGQVLKFMGDGALAVFPCDEGDGHACESARRAALALIEKLGALSREVPIRMGVGLHLGEVAYGNIGSPSRLDFTVIGSAVNLAARVESQCRALGQTVLATKQVAEHNPAGWSVAGEAELKGVAGTTRLYCPSS